MTKVRWSNRKARQFRSPLLVVGAFEGMKKPEGTLQDLDVASNGWVGRVLASGDFEGKKGRVYTQQTLGALPCDRLMFLGLGKAENWTLDVWRQCMGVAAKACRRMGIRRYGVSIEPPPASSIAQDDLAYAATEGALLGLYRFLDYKSEKQSGNAEADIEEIHLVPGGRGNARMRRRVQEAEMIAQAVNWVRNLVSHPSNRMTPTTLAEWAVEMAQSLKIKHRVLGKPEIEKMGMGGLLGVASGSNEPPRLIVLEYRAQKAKAPKMALVGKGITFDTGGISIKPAAKMDLMKNDMAGAAAVLGTLKAAAMLGLPVDLIGIVPATENMPGGSAYKPGDVLKTMSGKTIEVVNTDAEGRVILADALAYAETFHPDAIVDLATLTGACVVALGDRVAGMMGTDSTLLDRLQAAGEQTGETVWPLPLKEEYEGRIKSDIADVKNSGGREAGAITAGLFLKKFVKSTPWVHLDVAGPVWADKELPYQPKGATGFGVRLLTAWLQGL